MINTRFKKFNGLHAGHNYVVKAIGAWAELGGMDADNVVRKLEVLRYPLPHPGQAVTEG